MERLLENCNNCNAATGCVAVSRVNREITVTNPRVYPT